MRPGIYSLLVRYLPRPSQHWDLILLNLALHVSSSADMCNAKTQLMASMGPMSCVINYFRDTGAVHWTRLADSIEKACCLDFVGPPDRALVQCLPPAGVSDWHRCATDGRYGQEYAWKRGKRAQPGYMASPKLTCIPLPRPREHVFSTTGEKLAHRRSADGSSHRIIH